LGAGWDLVIEYNQPSWVDGRMERLKEKGRKERKGGKRKEEKRRMDGLIGGDGVFCVYLFVLGYCGGKREREKMVWPSQEGCVRRRGNGRK